MWWDDTSRDTAAWLHGQAQLEAQVWQRHGRGMAWHSKGNTNHFSTVFHHADADTDPKRNPNAPSTTLDR